MSQPDITLQRVQQLDAATLDALVTVFAQSRRIAMPWLPILHTKDEDRAFLADYLPDSQLWVAYDQNGLQGFIIFDEDWIDQLYLHPDARRQGMGSALLGKALADGQPRQLWCFQQNAAARAFYERFGFTAVDFTDGAANEEKLPDVLYRHPGRQ